MQPIVVKLLVVLDHHEVAGKGNKENIEKVNESFILMKDTLCIFKKLRENFVRKYL